MNYLPILVATVVGFGLSALWYSPLLFGKEWMDLQKISESEALDRQRNGIWKSYVAQFIFSLITFGVLAFGISLAGANTSSDGAFLGVLAWLGFIIPISVSAHLWKKESLMLVFIDAVNNLIVLAVGGAILGAWR